MSFTIRPARAAQWQLLKYLRISALTEAPDAFGPTAAEALSFDDAYWQRFAQYFESPWRHMFIALTDDTALSAGSHDLPGDFVSKNADRNTGMTPHEFAAGDACGLISAGRERDGTGHLGAFWVDPRSRGTGLGARLFDAALAWLEVELRCPRVELSVTQGNDQAEAMYRRRGFARSGRFEPLREGSALRNVYMAKDVARVTGAAG